MMKFIEIATDLQIAETAQLAGEIWRECYGLLLEKEQIEYMLSHLQSPAALQNQMQAQGYQYYLLQAENEVIGYLGLQPKNGKLYLSKFYLRAASRGKGYAPLVMQFVENQARNFGCHSYWLTVNKQNSRAIAAYQKQGMSLTGQQVADIGGGFVMDDFIFEKIL